jgi:hypothetical protein
MWIKKINDFFDNISEYDNNTLGLHFAVDLIDMLKERIEFKVDDDCNVSINLLPYKEAKEEGGEVDSEGFLYWLQFTFHKELIDIIQSLKEKFSGLQNNYKKLANEIKLTQDEAAKKKLTEKLTTVTKELDALKMILSRVDTYRRNTFASLRDKDSIDKVINHIRIYKEQSE